MEVPIKLELNTTNAIIAGGTGAAQYVQLYGSGSEKLKTIGSGVTVTGTAFSDQLSVSGVATATSFVKIWWHIITVFDGRWICHHRQWWQWNW